MMDFSKEFEERYKKLSNADLMEILEHPAHYQPEALDIATKELNARQLSETEIQHALLLLEEKKLQKESRVEKNQFTRSEINETGDVLDDIVNPNQNTKANANNLVRLIAIIFFGFGIYQFYSSFQVLLLLLNGKFHDFVGYGIFIFPVFLMIIGSILLWSRKQTGWIILCFISCFSLVLAAWLLLNAIGWIFNKTQFTYFRTSASTIISLLFYVAVMYVLTGNDVKEIFNIDKQKMQWSIISGVLVGIFFLFSLYFLF